jgi:hypothetical protein
MWRVYSLKVGKRPMAYTIEEEKDACGRQHSRPNLKHNPSLSWSDWKIMKTFN